MRHIGVSNFDVAQLRRAQAIAPVETLQPPYSLLERGIEDEILPFAQSEGIGVINYSPMASGLLSGAMTAERVAALPDDDWRKHDERFTSPSSCATWPWWRACRRSPTATTPPPGRSRSRGRCTTPR